MILVIMGAFLALSTFSHDSAVFAENSESNNISHESHFVTIYDEGSTLTVKTTATTVREALERAEIAINEADLVDPGLDTEIGNNTDFYINIHRARPALVIDGVNREYLMTASFDPIEVAKEAGLTVYDGDIVEPVFNSNFLEAGAVSTFRINRNGGRTLTLEEVLPYPVETNYDFTLAKGERRLDQVGVDGRRVSIYEVQFENNIEVSRTLVSEEIKVAPVPEIITIGAKVSIPPEREQCAGWAREAGVSEEDLEAAIDLIYRESGCRVDATNPSSGAYGIPQALPGSKMASIADDWETNPVTQIRWMTGYVNERYGGWNEALAYWWCTGSCTNRYGTITKNGTWY